MQDEGDGRLESRDQGRGCGVGGLLDIASDRCGILDERTGTLRHGRRKRIWTSETAQAVWPRLEGWSAMSERASSRSGCWVLGAALCDELR